MRTQARWTERMPESEGVRPPVTDLCFNPGGDQVVCAAGTRVYVYSASNGSLLHSLKGHKDTVYCVAYSADGKRFSSGGADRTVIIWTSRGDGILKYQHQDSILSMAYNPVTGQLASVTATDYGIWSIDQKNVSKQKLANRGLSCSWSLDGQHLAIGMFDGNVSIRGVTGEERRVISRGGPAWSVAFSPVRDEGQDILAVGSWDRKIAFFTVDGKMVGKEKDLPCDPTCVSYFSSGEYLLVTGSDRKAGLYSKDGTFLVNVAEAQDWIWAAKQRPRQFFIGTASNDGVVAGVELNITTVHSIYQEHYVYRDSLTDFVVQHLMSDRRLRMQCRDYVKKVAMFKDRAAVQLSDKIIVYDITVNDQNVMQYKEKERIRKKLDCSLLCVTASNLILCQDKRLTLYDFQGNKQREWAMDSAIRYIKVVGGLAEREALLVGLRNGLVAKIFVDNSFPTTLVKLNVPVRCLDLSATRSKLAVVDENNALQVYALGPNGTSELLFQEPHATAVAWNNDYEEMLCYSGGGMLSIKTGDLPPYQQKLQGFVVGFKGNKIFTLHSATMHTIDVPHSHALYRYVERKDFANAYKIACLGLTDEDWRMLGMHALSSLQLDIARKAFIRIKEVKLVELLNRIELERRVALGSGDKRDVTSIVLGDILAYQGKYVEAAKCFIRSNQEEKAVTMYCDLKMWEEARNCCSNKAHVAEMMHQQAQWAETMGDYREAAQLAISVNDFPKAIRLLGDQGEVDKLIEVCRTLTKADHEAISQCAVYFRKHKAMTYAVEAYERIGDIKGLLLLHVEQGMWKEAFAIIERHPQYTAEVYVPWALWLATHDRFDEAQEAFKKAGRPRDALRITEQLAGNSIVCKKFNDAAYYFLRLAGECGAIQTGDKPPNADEWGRRIAKYHDYVRTADLYYAYHLVHRYMTQPFTSAEPLTIFNAAKFLLAVLSDKATTLPQNISRVDVLLALGRLTSAMELNRMARTIYERLQQYVLPVAVQEQLDIASLAIRGRPYVDKEEYLNTCFRCGQALPSLMAPGDRCTNCFHPFVRSFVSFEPLPLVEFILSPDLTDEKAEQMITTGTGRKPKAVKEWKELQQANALKNAREAGAVGSGAADVITFNDNIVDIALQSGGDADHRDPFARQLVQIELNGRSSGQYVPLVCDAEMLSQFRQDEVFIVKGSKLANGLPSANKYYRLMVTSVGVTLCERCQHFFHDEEFEFETMKGNGCPLCRYKREDALQKEEPLH